MDLAEIAEVRNAPRTGPLDVLIVLAENWRLLACMPILCGLFALGITFLVPPTYTATTQILTPQQHSGLAGMLVQQLGSLGGLAEAATGLKNPTDQYIGLLGSRSIADRLIDRFKLRELYDVEFGEDARKALAARTSFSAGVKDNIISISVDDTDPIRSAEIANAYVEELKRLLSTVALTESSQRRVFFEAQLRGAKEELIKAEAALRGSTVSQSTLRIEPRIAIDEIARLQAAVTAAEIKVATLRGYLSENNSDLRQAQQELAVLRSQISKAERTAPDGVDRGGIEYISRYRNFKFYELLFEMIAKQYEVARLDEANEGVVMQIVDIATPPERKSKPRKGLIAIGVTIGVFFALLLFLLVKDAVRPDPTDVIASGKIQRLHRALRLRARA